MAQQVYELNSNGVYGLRNGVYADSLVTVVDSFEDQDLSEYTGDTASFSFGTSPVSDGAYNIELMNVSGGPEIISTSGLPAYPRPGDTYRVDCWIIDDTAWAQTYFGVVDASNYYIMEVNDYAGEIALAKVSSGSRTELAATSVTIPLDTRITQEVVWKSDGTMNYTAYTSSSTLGTVSATDTTHTASGIGFRQAQGGDSEAWDYARVV